MLGESNTRCYESMSLELSLKLIDQWHQCLVRLRHQKSPTTVAILFCQLFRQLIRQHVQNQWLLNCKKVFERPHEFC